MLNLGRVDRLTGRWTYAAGRDGRQTRALLYLLQQEVRAKVLPVVTTKKLLALPLAARNKRTTQLLPAGTANKRCRTAFRNEKQVCYGAACRNGKHTACYLPYGT